ncbi:YutD family protein [Lacticaseibacillus mingshuiensis]|uniref:YutD family protein n=1 Tax=Lacticaseibacillus mingshuiensis TaxID=2799574 RepID=A0ABW4CFR4_9LACO|nr:YutD family protein [Lacticaseibacillus mingshuiensis]
MAEQKNSRSLSDQIEQATAPGEPLRVVQLAPDLITIDQRRYRIEVDHKQAFDRERLSERYNEILDKYDYVVGDWGYDQLRLRGFYRADDPRAPKDQLISTLEDYLYEYCNFGCAYFVLARLDAPAVKPPRRRTRGSRAGKNGAETRDTRPAKPYTEQKVHAVDPKGKQVQSRGGGHHRRFTIRQRDDQDGKKQD